MRGMVLYLNDSVGTVRSPVASIATRFFALLAGESDLSVSARRCYAHAILDHTLPLKPDGQGTHSVDSLNQTLDSEIKTYFTSPPQIVLIQGPFRVDFVLEEPPAPSTPKSTSTFSSGLTALNGPTDLLDVLFTGFTLHNELLRCSKEDQDQLGRLSFFTLATLGESSLSIKFIDSSLNHLQTFLSP